MERARDRGIVTSVEMMYVLIFALVALVFIGYLGRLHAAGVQVTNTSQAAARAASQAANSEEGAAAASAAVAGSSLSTRCAGGGAAAMSWTPSETGTWQGGAVTVTVTCVVENASLSGIWSPGSRTISVSDTQPIDRYKR
jgi:Flp pilus assembly protein TadG